MVLGGNKRKVHTDSEEGFGVNASIRVILFKKIGSHSKIKRAGLDTKKNQENKEKMEDLREAIFPIQITR